MQNSKGNHSRVRAFEAPGFGTAVSVGAAGNAASVGAAAGGTAVSVGAAGESTAASGGAASHALEPNPVELLALLYP